MNTEDFSIGAISMTHLPVASSADKTEIKKAKRAEKANARAEKFLHKVEKVFQTKRARRTLGNISDPVDRWFWIWGISWGVGLLITLIAGGAIASTAIGFIWLLAFTVGAAALIIWLLKKFT